VNPLVLAMAGIAIFFSKNKCDNWEDQANEKMDALLEGHKRVLRESMFLTSKNR